MEYVRYECGQDEGLRVMVTSRHLLESGEIDGIQGFEYRLALVHSNQNLDHLGTSGHQDLWNFPVVYYRITSGCSRS